MFKRLVAAATAVVLTVAMSVSAFAATTEATRNSILNALTTGNGLKTTDEYYKQAEQFLSRTDVTITQEQASQVVSDIKELRTTLKNDGVKDVTEFKEKFKNDSTFAEKITGKVNTIAKKAGVTNVVIGADGTIEKFVYDNKTFVPNASGDFAPTGVDFSTTAAVVAGLGLSVAGIAVIAKKKDLVNA